MQTIPFPTDISSFCSGLIWQNSLPFNRLESKDSDSKRPDDQPVIVIQDADNQEAEKSTAYHSGRPKPSFTNISNTPPPQRSQQMKELQDNSLPILLSQLEVNSSTRPQSIGNIHANWRKAFANAYLFLYSRECQIESSRILFFFNLIVFASRFRPHRESSC